MLHFGILIFFLDMLNINGIFSIHDSGKYHNTVMIFLMLHSKCFCHEIAAEICKYYTFNTSFRRGEGKMWVGQKISLAVEAKVPSFPSLS